MAGFGIEFGEKIRLLRTNEFELELEINPRKAFPSTTNQQGGSKPPTNHSTQSTPENGESNAFSSPLSFARHSSNGEEKEKKERENRKLICIQGSGLRRQV